MANKQVKTIKEAHKEYLDKILELDVDINNDKELKNFFETITVAQAEDIGMRNFDKDLYLFPGCFLDFLPNGLKVYSIMGSEKIVGRDYIDNDTRFGLLAYGIKIKGQKDE